jgi:preprotein translocase subunit Sec61beta
MPEEKIQMPQAMGGLVRYFDDYKSKVEFKPGHIILLAVIVMVVEIILHVLG